MIKPAYTLFLKTGTWCNAGCISCPAGRKLPEDKESSGLMRPEMMARILNYVEQFGVVLSATHHYYNEPTANPYTPTNIETCHQHGVRCLMSTNGSFWKGLQPVMEQGLTNLIFSVSGWSQAIHERSHNGVNVETLRENMVKTAEICEKRKWKDFCGERMFVRVSWHNYDYNRHEMDKMREFSENLGFNFTVYDTGLLPLERAQARMIQAMKDPGSPMDVGERDLRTKLAEAAKLCYDRRHFPCINQQRMLTIDSDGYLHNCCVKAHDANRRGLLFETDLEEFNQYRLEKDSDCKKCKAHGHHQYAMQSYREPNTAWNLMKWRASGAWRDLRLNSLFPSVSNWRSKGKYVRPRKAL